MTIFLIALAVGVVAAVGLWALGRRAPLPSREQRPRPIGDNIGHIVFVLILSGIEGARFRDAWDDFDRAISQMQTASPSDFAVYASQAQGARLDLVAGAAVMTVLLVALSVFISRLIQAIRRHVANASAKPEETHA